MQLNERTIAKINQILSNAYDKGREVLHEQEVYAVLNILGLEVPEYDFITDPSLLTEDVLKKYGQNIVIKVVSPQIAHKQKLGGVKIIRNSEAGYVKYTINAMKEEIFSHFDESERPVIEGFLLVEFIPFTQAIGYETLIGFKEDPAFGSVLTLSKGGDDAEFFAKYYDPANLIIPPFNREQAMELLNTMNIRHKFNAIGHGEYLEKMAEAASVLSCLAYDYSRFSGSDTGFILSEMDINPFVITKDHRFVAVDGFAKFMPAAKGGREAVPKARKENLGLFFRPKGVAVIGVSADMGKHSMAREIAHMLHDMGRDDICLVNARGGSLMFDKKEYPLYKEFSDIRENVDLIVYAAPAQFTVDFVSKLPKDEPKAVVLISGIPSEMKYTDFKSQLDAVIPAGTRIIGPNCIGVYHSSEENSKGINTFFLDEKRLEVKSSPTSNTALLTQSGALAITLIDKMKVSKLFKAVVSFGNKYDVRTADLIEWFEHEPDIDLISTYIEGFDQGEGRSFFELARNVSKPIIAYKSGKTEAGAKAAASHTASMSGSYEVFEAACSQAGVILAEKIEDYEDYMKAFSLLSHRIPAGNRVAGVLNAGFESTVGADELKHLKQAVLSEETVKKLKEIDRNKLVDFSSSFLDVTPSADDGIFADFTEAVLQDDNVDCVFVANVPHSHALKSDPASCRDTDSLATRLAEMAEKYDKPIVVSINAGEYYRELVSATEESGLPVYGDVRSAVKSLDKFVSYHLMKKEQNRA